MKNILKIKSQKITEEILENLEKKGLIRTLKAPANVLHSKSRQGTVRTIYSSKAEYGSHKLICVKCNSSKINLNCHPDNEEFLLINNTNLKFNPLFIIIALEKGAGLQKKIKNFTLTTDDFIVLELKYNDPRISIFTMLKGTYHCEFTIPGKEISPVFFVTEPSRLQMIKEKLCNYQFIVV